MSNFTKLTWPIVVILSLFSCSSHSTNEDTDACDMIDIAMTSNHFGIGRSTIKEVSRRESKDGSRTSCEWGLKDSSGAAFLIHLKKQERNSKITNPNYFENSIQYEIDNGRIAFGKSVDVKAGILGDHENGAFSIPLENKFTKSISYTWREKEERRYTLTLTKTQDSRDGVVAPTKSELEKIASLFRF